MTPEQCASYRRTSAAYGSNLPQAPWGAGYFSCGCPTKAPAGTEDIPFRCHVDPFDWHLNDPAE